MQETLMLYLLALKQQREAGSVSNKFVYTGCDNLEVMAVAEKYNRYLISIVTNSVKNIKNKKILDFGAGSGTYADILKEWSLLVDCLEPDLLLTKTLKNKNYMVHSNAAMLDAESYDIIYSFNVFEHIKDDFEAAAQVSKALKPGGRLVIYVPAFQSLYSSMDKKVEHIRRYRVERLRKIAEDNELIINELRYCDPVGFFAAFFYKYFGSKDGSISVKSIKIYDKFIFPASRVLEFFTKKFFGKNALLIATKK